LYLSFSSLYIDLASRYSKVEAHQIS
jgi:hypothetical protein